MIYTINLMLLERKFFAQNISPKKSIQKYFFPYFTKKNLFKPLRSIATYSFRKTSSKFMAKGDLYFMKRMDFGIMKRRMIFDTKTS